MRPVTPNMPSVRCICRDELLMLMLEGVFDGRSGSRMNNWQLYPRVLHELARTSRVSSGRACLLTHDHKCMLKVVATSAKHVM